MVIINIIVDGHARYVLGVVCFGSALMGVQCHNSAEIHVHGPKRARHEMAVTTTDTAIPGRSKSVVGRWLTCDPPQSPQFLTNIINNNLVLLLWRHHLLAWLASCHPSTMRL